MVVVERRGGRRKGSTSLFRRTEHTSRSTGVVPADPVARGGRVREPEPTGLEVRADGLAGGFPLRPLYRSDILVYSDEITLWYYSIEHKEAHRTILEFGNYYGRWK